MKRLSIASLCMVALLGTYGNAQDIILLNQDGEEVGVAKDVEEKQANDAPAVDAEKPAAEKESAKIENGVVKIVGPDGEVMQFKMSDARSISITQSSKTVIGEDGKPKIETSGKAVLVGPDGVRREVDLETGENKGTGEAIPKSWTIGASYQAVSPILRSQLQLDDDVGLVIKQVLPNGAAAKSGLKANDIILYAEQKPVSNQKQLSELINEAGAAESQVSLTVLRGGEELSITATPTEREGMSAAFAGGGLVFPRPGLRLRGFGNGRFGAGGEDMREHLEREMNRVREEMKALRGGFRGFDPFDDANPFENDDPFAQ